jgi:hypothetical protein
MPETLSLSTILTIYTPTEIDAKIVSLKTELDNLYSSVSAAGKSGTRSVELVRADLEAFAQAKRALTDSAPGLVRTQAA